MNKKKNYKKSAKNTIDLQILALKKLKKKLEVHLTRQLKQLETVNQNVFLLVLENLDIWLT